MIKFEKSDSKNCIMCCVKNIETTKVIIDRKSGKDNIITFSVCNECLNEMYMNLRYNLFNY